MFNQKGITHILVLLILVTGLIAGLYLVQHPAIFKPKAGGGISGPIVVETSFTLSPAENKDLPIGYEFPVTLLVRSDLDAANLFAAKIKFPKELLEVVSINTGQSGRPNPGPKEIEGDETTIEEGDETTPSAEPSVSPMNKTVCNSQNNFACPSGYQCDVQACTANPLSDDQFCTGVCQPSSQSTKPHDYFIANWVEKYFNNGEGTISLIGGVPNPGFQTVTDGKPSPIMATIIFKTKKVGQGTISFDNASAIYRNLDNTNILTTKRNSDFEVIKSNTCQKDSDCEDGQSCQAVDCPRIMAPCSPEGGCPSQPPCSLTSICVPNENRFCQNDSQCPSGWKCELEPTPSPCIPGSPGSLECDAQPAPPMSICRPPQKPVPSVLPSPCQFWESFCRSENACKPLWESCPTEILPSPKPSPTQLCSVCNADITKNGAVNGQDISFWNFCQGKPLSTSNDIGSCSNADINQDGVVDNTDLTCIQSNLFQSCPSTSPAPSGKPVEKGDGNGDGKIDLVDLSVLFSQFNKHIKGAVDMNGDGVINTFDFAILRKLLIEKKVIRGN